MTGFASHRLAMISEMMAVVFAELDTVFLPYRTLDEGSKRQDQTKS